MKHYPRNHKPIPRCKKVCIWAHLLHAKNLDFATFLDFHVILFKMRVDVGVELPALVAHRVSVHPFNGSSNDPTDKKIFNNNIFINLFKKKIMLTQKHLCQHKKNYVNASKKLR
jgi:hypothetical protein